VNRWKLIEYLNSKGCGAKFLNAIKDSMTSTGLLEQDTFSTRAGVKQVSVVKHLPATLFPSIEIQDILFVLLMDDTAVFATTREKLVTKLQKPK
jgi:hypothetical protein